MTDLNSGVQIRSEVFDKEDHQFDGKTIKIAAGACTAIKSDRPQRARDQRHLRRGRRAGSRI